MSLCVILVVDIINCTLQGERSTIWWERHLVRSRLKTCGCLISASLRTSLTQRCECTRQVLCGAMCVPVCLSLATCLLSVTQWTATSYWMVAMSTIYLVSCHQLDSVTIVHQFPLFSWRPCVSRSREDHRYRRGVRGQQRPHKLWRPYLRMVHTLEQAKPVCRKASSWSFYHDSFLVYWYLLLL